MRCTEFTHRDQLCTRGIQRLWQKMDVHSRRPERPGIGMRTFTSLSPFFTRSYLRVQPIGETPSDHVGAKPRNTPQRAPLHSPLDTHKFTNWGKKHKSCPLSYEKLVVLMVTPTPCQRYMAWGCEKPNTPFIFCLCQVTD